MTVQKQDHPTALVTGSTAGIGRAIALSLAEQGYSLVLSGRREPAEVKPLIEEIEAANKRKDSCVYVRGDIAEERTRENLVSAIRERYGALRVLVNNAGITTAGRKDILDLTEEDMLYLLRVNLVSPFLLTSRTVPLLKENVKKNNARSYVINISSISAYTVSTSRADYCISKAGMSMMTQQFAARLAGDSIGVFELRPGIIKTDMTAAVREKYDVLIEEGLLPVPRWGEPGDIARAVTGIVQENFPYSTGEVFNIDGGFHIRRL
ncbi:MAG: 3-ketoacyl-ACP reductase [bacterium]|nr:3-ketoacyl-ACP reductase [bacterium]